MFSFKSNCGYARSRESGIRNSPRMLEYIGIVHILVILFTWKASHGKDLLRYAAVLFCTGNQLVNAISCHIEYHCSKFMVSRYLRFSVV